MQTMKQLTKYIVLLLAGLVSGSAGCSDAKPAAVGKPGKMVTDVYIAPSMPVYAGEKLRLLGAGFAEGDELLLRGSGTEFSAPVEAVTESYACFTVPGGITSDGYSLVLRRGADEQLLAYTKLRPAPDWTLVPDREGATVKGVVYCGLKPLAGVRVSDGVVTVTTDENGYYWLPSEKYHGYVFITLPSGYEPYTEDTTVPAFWASLTGPQAACEQHNFELVEADNERHTMLVATDLHLANRPSATGDLTQFGDGFLTETKAFIAAQQRQQPVYTLMLGDMTWDEFWYSNLYGLSNYKTTMAGYPSLLFHVMGNHDNDPYRVGDFAGEAMYKSVFGPTYYSMNIGRVHYIVLDNTVYINDNGAEGTIGSRNYKRYVTEMQLEWLRDDLAAVGDKSMPVVVGFHCQSMNNYNATFANKPTFNPSSGTGDLIACFDGFSCVIFLSGHTHYNAHIPYSPTLEEHNVAAVCETWWWAGKLSGVNVCKDGAPAGYAVYEADGTDLKWYYKGVGHDRDKQFLSYDMNSVKAFYKPEVVELLSQWPSRAKDGQGDDYFDVEPNTVFINVWNYDPEWTISVTENGRPLEVTRVWHRDPLHTICFDYPRLKAGLAVVADWESLRHSHMFSVRASEPGTTLRIEVTDRFGRTSSEVMRRPKDFTTDMK